MPPGAPSDVAPALHLRPDGSASCHATTVAIGERALLIAGPSGSGKSGLAAQLLALGAGLVADDVTILEACEQKGRHKLRAARPEGAPARLELRHLGIVDVAPAPPTEVAALLVLGPSGARLPEETTSLLGVTLPVIRHPVTTDLAAKALLWMRAS